MSKKISIPTKPNVDEWVQSDSKTETKVKASSGKRKRLTLDLPGDLHKAIKRQAVEEGKSMVEILRSILDEKFGSRNVQK